MSRHHLPSPLARVFFALSGALFVCCALGLCGTAWAANKKPTETHGEKRPSKVTFIDSPSSESPAARKKRLKIECKGRPNAGACLGLTR